MVARNQATAGTAIYGGGVYFDTGGLFEFNVVGDNAASAPTVEGAGVYASCNNHFRYNNVVRNVTGGATTVRGAALRYIAESTVATIRYNTLVANSPSAVDQVGGIYVTGRPDMNDGNNLYSAAGYELYYDSAQTDSNLDASNIYWGTTQENLIVRDIYDWFDKSTLGLVDYRPYATTRYLDAPPSPPTGVRLWVGNGQLYLSWSANPEADIAGYKVYYDTDGGLPYLAMGTQGLRDSGIQGSEGAEEQGSGEAGERLGESEIGNRKSTIHLQVTAYPYEGQMAAQGVSPIDVGNATAYTLTGLTNGTTHYVAVSAYDSSGNESWVSVELSAAPNATPGSPPTKPTNGSPAGGATGVSVSTPFTATAFSDPDGGDTHQASWWQITSATGDYAAPVYDSGQDALNKTDITPPGGTLAYGTAYCWHVRYQDSKGNWSLWSNETCFTTESSSFLSGQFSTHTTLTAAGSPYRVVGNLRVNQGVQLTIQPGVELRFDSGMALRVGGTLIARGTPTQPITFTSSAGLPQAGDWGYIHFMDTSVDATYDANWNYVSGSILEYVVVQYGGGISGIPAAVRVEASSPYIHNSTIRNNARRGIHVLTNSSPRIIGNTIKDNGSTSPMDKGGGIYAESACTIQDNTIQGNATYISADSAVGGGAGLWAVNSTIYNNTILNNTASSTSCSGSLYGGGAYASGGSVYSNTISNNLAQGTRYNCWNYAYGGGLFTTNSATVQQNVVSGNTASTQASSSASKSYGGGIYAGGGTVRDNTVTGNRAESNSRDTTETYGGGIDGAGSATLINNVVSGNTAWASSGSNGSAWAYGGGVSGANVLQGNTITNNTATATTGSYDASAYGGGVSGGSSLSNNVVNGNTAQATAPVNRTGNAGGGGISTSSATLTGNTVSSNRVTANRTDAAGGGINCDTCALNSNTVSGNSAQALRDVYGGGINLYSGTGSFSNNIVTGNVVTPTNYAYGAGVRFANASGAFSGNRITGNGVGSGTARGAGLYYATSAALTTISHNTVASNTASVTTQPGGVYVDGGTPVLSTGNSFYNNTRYNLYNATASNLNAASVYWGTSDRIYVEEWIYDKDDESAKGIVYYMPYSTTPDPLAPTMAGQVIQASRPAIEVYLAAGRAAAAPLALVNVGSEPFAYTVASVAAWLTPGRTAGTVEVLEADEVGLTVSAAGLEAGIYETAVTVHSADGQAARVPVKLVVTGGATYRIYLPMVAKGN